MKRASFEKAVATGVLIVALLLVGIGLVHTHKVYEAETEEYGLAAFIRLKDWQLVVDATFGGVENRNGKLYSTYDRAAGGGKRACPT